MRRSMKMVFQLAAVLVSLFVAGCAAPPPRSPSFTVVSAEFGLFRAPWGARDFFEPATVVPNKVGQPYGWLIQVKTDLKTIRWKEEFALPEAPRYWDGNQKQAHYSVSEDRKMSVSEREVPNDGGLLLNSWTVAPGDPKGKYEMRVHIEGQLVRVFKFVVD